MGEMWYSQQRLQDGLSTEKYVFSVQYQQYWWLQRSHCRFLYNYVMHAVRLC